MANAQDKSNSNKGLYVNDSMSDMEQSDFSNGFENRIVDFDCHSRDKNINVCSRMVPTMNNKYEILPDSLQSVIHRNSPKLMAVNQLEEAHSSVDKLSQQFHQDKSIADYSQCSVQVSTQTAPLLQTETQMHFNPESKEEFSNFSNIRSQFEIRAHMHSQPKHFEKIGHVSADKVSINSNIYRFDNPISIAQRPYVTVQQTEKMSLQSTIPQPLYYSGVIIPALEERFVASERQPQYSYSSCLETGVSAFTKEHSYNPHVDIYSPQIPSNHQRLIHDLTQYQTQHATQQNDQNYTHSITAAKKTDTLCRRGPKPMVPPRVNSKITYDPGNKTLTTNSSQHVAARAHYEQVTSTLQDKLQPNSVLTTSEPMPVIIDADNKLLSSFTQKQRTRQDGLFDDMTGIILPKEETVVGNIVYVSKLEKRKSMDVSTGISRSNDMGDFFDSNLELIKFDRPASSAIDIKQNDLNNAIFATDHKQVGEMTSFSPLERIAVSKESKRNDCLDEYRMCSMKMDGSRVEDIRKSPMLFVPIRDISLERGSQKSPSFQDQQFEKTRLELNAWAEQRQRQEIERGIQQNQFFIASPRTRNQLEDKIDEKLIQQFNNRKELRTLQPSLHPVPDISQNVLLEQRRHLRHVSADLTKHMELSNKEFNDHSISGSVTNLVPTTNVVWVQKANPTLYNQYPAHSETKIDTKSISSVAADFGDFTEKPFHQLDHIIHSHRKSHTSSSNLSTYSKTQTDKLQTQGNSKLELNDASHKTEQKQFQNQHQSLDYLSNKLKQCEIQQSDLHAKLQYLQNQNQFLDKVAQFQNRQSDMQLHPPYFPLKNKLPENSRTHLLSTTIEGSSVEGCEQNELSPILQQNQKGLLNKNHIPSIYSSASSLQASNTYDKVPPRLQQKEISDQFSSEVSNVSYPSQSQLDINYSSRRSLTQLPTSSIHVTGTLKKIPPEKPPRTSLIMQTAEFEPPTQNCAENAEAKETAGSAADMYPNSGIISSENSNLQTLRGNDDIDKGHALVYRDGNLVSGSLEALIQHMVPTAEYYPDRAYLFAFLLSARLFIKPHELLGEVCALCESQQNLNGETGKERLLRFVHRLVQLLSEWTGIFPYDFRDERMMSHVKSITQKIAAVDAAVRQEVSNFLQNLLLRLTALERYEEGLARLAKESTTEQLTQVDLLELCPSATILAQQLTHVELERLSYIGPEEFVQAFAKELPHLETSFKEMKKTRNLESYVQWFNRLSYFVATEVSKHVKKKQRVRVVEYWIETARECFNIGNFNSLMAIIAGLNMSSITRMRKTWSKVQTSKFSILEHQMDPSSNFSSYRSTLKAAMWRSAGATDEQQRIVIPFFSLLVKDLYFLNEGCSNKLPNGHINFEKFWQLAKQVTEFLSWKQVVCPFEKDGRVIAFLQASPVLTENALALASFECEPPDTNHEKERYKTLKAEHSM